MKISRKIAVAAIPAVMALSAATDADSKILLMSQEGWEVSFDGAANAFFMKNSGTDNPSLSGGNSFTPSTYAGVIGANCLQQPRYTTTIQCEATTWRGLDLLRPDVHVPATGSSVLRGLQLRD